MNEMLNIVGSWNQKKVVLIEIEKVFLVCCADTKRFSVSGLSLFFYLFFRYFRHSTIRNIYSIITLKRMLMQLVHF